MRWTAVWVSLVTASACTPIPMPLVLGADPVPAGGYPTPKVWVDLDAPAGGDGTESHPFRDLAHVLETPGALEVVLRPGLYTGPFMVGAEVHLRGPRTAVLHGERGTAVRLGAGAGLHGLTVQGGAVGVELQDDAQLDAVALSGQRTVAVSVAHGAARLEGCLLEATVSETTGVQVAPGATLRARQLEVRGPYRRGIDVSEGGELELKASAFQDAVSAVFARGASVTLEDVSTEGGRGPGVFAARGSLVIRGLRTRGHEYGLETRELRDAQLRQLELTRSQVAALALVKSSATVEDLSVIEPGSFGAIQLIQSDVNVTRFRIERASEQAISAREGRVSLRDGVIRGVKASSGEDGNAIDLRAAVAQLRDVRVLGADGFGLVASEGARVSFSQLQLGDCGAGGLFVDVGAKLEGASLTVERSQGFGLVVPESGRATVDGLVLKSLGNGPVFAECAHGAQVELSHLQSDVPVVPTPCVRVR